MKTFFIVVLVANLLTEGMAAVLLITGPLGVSAVGQLNGGMWAMNYGFAAVAIASAIFWIWPHRTDSKVVAAGLGILLTFHACLFISLAIAGDQLPGTIIHAIMAVCCAVLYAQRSKWCTE